MRFHMNSRHGCGGGFGRHLAERREAWLNAMKGDDSDDGFGGGFGGFGRRGGGWGGGGRFGGKGRGRMFASGELRLLLLSLVAEQERHGYELIKAIEELTGGEYAPSPGVVYPTLSLLTDEGLVAEVAGEGARKAFAVTDAGRAELAGRTGELKTIVDRLTGLAETRARESSPPVRRAMANLMIALRQRAAQGLETDDAQQVADILDEAARRIERL